MRTIAIWCRDYISTVEKGSSRQVGEARSRVLLKFQMLHSSLRRVELNPEQPESRRTDEDRRFQLSSFQVEVVQEPVEDAECAKKSRDAPATSAVQPAVGV